MAMALSPEEQNRFRVSPATDTGSPARIAATRAMLCPCDPCGWPQPMITSSTSFESSCGTLPRTSLMAWAVKSSGRVRLNEPRNDLASGVRELATMTASLITVSFLDGRDGHDLDQVLGRRQPRLHGRSRRGVGGIDPGVPGGVHVAVHPHVGHVHGGGEDLRLVAADRRQRLVDLLENLLGLALRVRGRVGRHHAGQIHRVAVDDCLGEPRPAAVTLDAHALFLSAPEMGPERYRR